MGQLKAYLLTCANFVRNLSTRSTLVALILITNLSTVQAQTPPQLIGKWKFTSMFYRGQELPPPNPDLNLYFEFYEGGMNRLFWNRTNESGFCEREAHYEIDGSFLKQLVVWVNPENDFSCSKDTDMQMGTRSLNSFRVSPEKFELDLTLADETLVYIFTRQ